MRRRVRAAGFLSVIVVIAALVAPSTGEPQPGTVISYQKISDTQGNFTAPLTNLCELGGAATSLGDLDGAGPSVQAMAVGSALDDDGGGDRGAVYIMFLNAAGGVLSYQKISDTQGNFAEPLINLDQFGSSLAYLGDLDGEGPSAAALAVGTVGEDDGGTDRGCVYILFLATTGNVLSYVKISDTVGNLVSPLDNLDEFGGAVASLGDLDTEGPSKVALAVGAVGDDDGGGNRGAVYILFLSSTGAVLSEQKISDTQGNFLSVLDNDDDFGTSVASVGDLDGPSGPSRRAIAVGAAFDDDGGVPPAADRGAVYILFLNTNGVVMAEQKISDTQGNFTDFFSDADEFGGAVQHLGDLDGTGGSVASLAVGVAGDDDGGEDRGAFHVLFLNAAGLCVGSQKVSDFYGNFLAIMRDLDALGSSLAFLGDLDGPGPTLAAVAVGATGDDDGGVPPGADRGAVYIMFLDSIVPATGGIPLPTFASGGALGRAVPNPFRPETTIPFRLEETAQVRIDIWDVSGRLVRRLVDEALPGGDHKAVWNGRDDAGRTLAAGTYFYRMTLGGRVASGTERVLLIR